MKSAALPTAGELFLIVILLQNLFIMERRKPVIVFSAEISGETLIFEGQEALDETTETVPRQIPTYRFLIERFLTLKSEKNPKEIAINYITREITHFCQSRNIALKDRKVLRKLLQNYILDFIKIFIR